MASASIRNPQTFNRYSYVTNSPYKFTDPLGLFGISPGGGQCGQQCSVLPLGNYSSRPSQAPPQHEAEHNAENPSSAAEQNEDKIYQREVRTYTVLQTEADGRQATITITAEIDRVIDKKSGKTIDSSNPRVRATAENTGTALFSSADLDTLRYVSQDIVNVALTVGIDPRVILAQAQREAHLGVGSFGDRASNRSLPEMGQAVNPIQVDGNVNGGRFASTTDRKGNILLGINQLLNDYPASKDFAERLGHYNAGGIIGAKGREYANDILQKSNNIRESHKFVYGTKGYQGVNYPIIY